MLQDVAEWVGSKGNNDPHRQITTSNPVVQSDGIFVQRMDGEPTTVRRNKGKSKEATPAEKPFAPISRPTPAVPTTDEHLHILVRRQARQVQAESDRVLSTMADLHGADDFLGNMPPSSPEMADELEDLRSTYRRDATELVNDDKLIDRLGAEIEEEDRKRVQADKRLERIMQLPWESVPPSEIRRERLREQELDADAAETERILQNALAQSAAAEATLTGLHDEIDKTRRETFNILSPEVTRASQNSVQQKVILVTDMANTATRAVLAHTTDVAAISARYGLDLSKTALATIASADVISQTAAPGIALPFSGISLIRASRQADRARLRMEAAARHVLTEAQLVTAEAVERRLSAVAKYAHAKNKRRLGRLGTQAGLDVVAIGGAITTLAGGVVTPVGIAGAAVATSAGLAKGAISGSFAVKGLIKKIRSTKGVARARNANELYNLAVVEKHIEAVEFLHELGVLKLPGSNTGHFTEPQLREPHQKDHVIAYIMQKLRS